ncbi:hypothetical protein BZA02_10220 [Ruegeria sp. P4]|nr:hypothetical protein BZA02_10220 [Ruegeria sp. P4]
MSTPPTQDTRPGSPSMQQWPGIAGRTVLVTGASSGLGAHFAELLAENGAHVVATARRLDRVQELCGHLTARGLTARPMTLDVTSPSAVRAAMADIAPDLLVNNAGVSHSCPALDLEPEALDAVIDTNIKGVFNVAQAAAANMCARSCGGRIVNVASILGSRVAGQVAAYAASKGAVLQMTRALALEWARLGIRVNALSPGYVETELNQEFFASDAGQALIRRIPTRRLGRPTDLDGPLLLLLSDLGRAMTGAELVVDGGHLVSSL